jgi:hypothetical protein
MVARTPCVKMSQATDHRNSLNSICLLFASIVGIQVVLFGSVYHGFDCPGEERPPTPPTDPTDGHCLASGRPWNFSRIQSSSKGAISVVSS